MRSRVRFIVAISLAAVLGGWLLYTSLGGALETYAGPGEVQAGSTYRLNALVAQGAPADAPERAQSAEGLRFTVIDKEDGQRLEVLYRGNVPDAFKDGREIVITGELQNDVFHAERNSMITLCPSKFSDNPSDHEPLVEIPDVTAS
jgi:cytochrome c-type biogenesis protein CcmE